MQQYTIRRADPEPGLDGQWESPAWQRAQTLQLAHFHERGGDHRPNVNARMLYDDRGLYLIFRVEDRFVRCVATNRNGSICADSCVEFFTESVADRGYFNFEINCGGTLLLHYNARPAAINYDPVVLDDDRLDLVRIHHSMPKVVDPEINDPVTWFIEMFAPYELFEAFVGPVPRGPGAVWRGNFYKCGDATSHPHWAMWHAIPGPLGFHQPEHFAPLIFAD